MGYFEAHTLSQLLPLIEPEEPSLVRRAQEHFDDSSSFNPAVQE
jgi:hypothetical protein